MGKATGFLEAPRVSPRRRDVRERLRDWNEVYLPQAPADLVVLAIGFAGPEPGPAAELGVSLDERGNIAVDHDFATSAEGVFCAGDAMRGASLIVWAIADGRRAAQGIDRYLAANPRLS